MMQDLRSMQATGGRMFGGGERRLRPFPNQALKCPRCESLNTKFCYYNNYNLSQPRHFCKNCRRYWTKGGVLRNVPVGGGCRKTKRSKPKPPSASSSDNKEKKSNNNIINNNNNTTCHSSSESSSLTNTTPTTEAASSSAGLHNTTTTNNNNNYQDSRSFFLNQTPESNFEPYTLDQQDGGVFPETGTFTSLMTVSNPSFLGYNFNEIYPFRLQHEGGQIQLQQQQEQHHHHQNSMIEDEIKMHELTATAAAAAAGCLDHQTVPIDLRGTGNGEAIDWQSNDQGLFDLPHTVDQGYWGQSQWTDNDQHLYLPP